MSKVRCCIDAFDGVALDDHWKFDVGEPPPEYEVSGERLLISDAPFADTPSMPTKSWIYDLSRDKGNQMSWAQEIGDSDFTLTAEIAWTSSEQEVTLGGVGVSDTSGRLGAIAGVIDDSQTEFGGAFAFLPSKTPFRPAQNAIGSARFTVQRVNHQGTVSFVAPGSASMSDSGPLPALISNVVVYFVRHHDEAKMYNFGSVEIRELQICRD